ncbi:MFS transporter [Halomicrobium salinisoli]|uniref:MFS transporter n=1 Tax=Halomicrobium salinisoli TaxID=2878391 RepID=UPI001CEFEA94|nr:MFS transporter [Halomicrobium salinisoli]
MTESNRRAWTAAIFATMALTGAAMMARGPIIPHLGTTFGAPEWQLGLIAPAGTAGYLVVISVVGFGAGHLDPRRFVLLGMVGSVVCLLAMAVAPLLAVFLLAVLVRGTMNGVVRGLNRPLLSHFYPERRGRVYSYYDMTWAAGAVVGPLAVVGAVALGNWRLAYVGMAAVMVALAVAVWRLDAPDVESEEEPIDWGEVLALLRRPEIVAMIAAMFFATGVEGGLFTWLPTYAEGELPPSLAGITLSVMIAGYVPGRFVYGRLADRVGYLPLLVGILLLLVPAFWAFLAADGPRLLAAVAAVGALISGVYPLLLSYATEAVPHHSGPVTALAAVSSSLGVGIVPAVMGGVISGSNVGAAMRLLLGPIVLALVVLVVARVAERRRDRAEATA